MRRCSAAHPLATAATPSEQSPALGVEQMHTLWPILSLTIIDR